MKVSDITANTIDHLFTRYTFTYVEFNRTVGKKDAVVEEMRLATSVSIHFLHRHKKIGDQSQEESIKVTFIGPQ